MRDRFIGLDMDKAKDELVKAYEYEADTHGQVVRDGLTLKIQVRALIGLGASNTCGSTTLGRQLPV